ncbi:unnamed protein product [Symbiodinium sp. CCMP2456]|nr:unnamed protein product [Symbiodinium sp. CCMP2456]
MTSVVPFGKDFFDGRAISAAEVDTVSAVRSSSDDRRRASLASSQLRPWTSPCIRGNAFQFDLCPNHTSRMNHRAPLRFMDEMRSCATGLRKSATGINGTGYYPLQLRECGETWPETGRSRSSSSRNVARHGAGKQHGWLRTPFESAEVSELGEAMRELFNACDTSEDGQIDLAEYVQAQMHLAQAVGDVFDRRVATHRFYSMQNARLGRVSFSGFFRAEVKRLQGHPGIVASVVSGICLVIPSSAGTVL